MPLLSTGKMEGGDKDYVDFISLFLLQTTVANALLPHLKKEQLHIKQNSVVRRPRETDVRATCGKRSAPVTSMSNILIDC